MTPDVLDRVAELLDRQAIWDCLLRYARGVDRLDKDLIRSAFWADAHDSHGQINGSPENFLAKWIPTQTQRQAGQHLMSNHSVHFDGPDAADTETYFLVAGKAYDSASLELVGGRYLDHLQKRSEEWRIKTRVVILDWQATADATGMAQRLARGHGGFRDRRDPSYERPVRARRASPGASVEPDAPSPRLEET